MPEFWSWRTGSAVVLLTALVMVGGAPPSSFAGALIGRAIGSTVLVFIGWYAYHKVRGTENGDAAAE